MILRGACVALALAMTARAGELETAHRVARAGIVEKLEELVAWCHSQKLFGDRDHFYAALLQFDEDHATARKWLKYVRRKGAWVRKHYRAPKNRNPKATAESARRRTQLARSFGAPLLERIDDDVKPAMRRRVLADILAIDPEYKQVRQLTGEVKSGNRWVLRETEVARKRGPELKQAAARALGDVPAPEQTGTGAFESKLWPKWAQGVRTDEWRVFSTDASKDIPDAAAVAQATTDLFNLAFGTEARPDPGMTIYYTSKQPNYSSLLSRHPSVDAATLKWAAKLKTYWPRDCTHIFVNVTTRAERLEWAARQPIGGLLRRAFRINTKIGWAWEGVGLYLTYALTGTHATWFIRRGGYARDDSRQAKELWKKLSVPGTDWFELAKELIAKRKRPHLALLLPKGVNTMTGQDLIFSYVLAAFLIEGRPEETPRLLRALGAGAKHHKALRNVLETDVERLEARLVRWLRERRAR